MKKYLGLLVGLALLLPMAAGAMEFKSGQSVSFSETVKDNVYVTGGAVNVAGTIDGDLYVAGGTVNIMGVVTGDVVAGGGTIIITGKVGEDLRVGGGNVTVGGSVGGELLVGAGNVTILPSVVITKGAYIGAGNVSMAGSVGGDLKLAGDTIVFGEGTKVAGNFDYYAQKEMDFSAAKIGGKTTFHQQTPNKSTYVKKAGWWGFATIWSLVGLVASLILVYLLYYVWRKDSSQMIAAAFASPGKELLRGFALMFLIPIAAVILLITVIGFPLAFLAGFSYAVLLILSAAVSTLLGAALLAKFVFKEKETDLNWWLILLAVVIMSVLKLIPFVGWIINFLILLVALGVLGNKIYSKLAPEK